MRFSHRARKSGANGSSGVACQRDLPREGYAGVESCKTARFLHQIIDAQTVRGSVMVVRSARESLNLFWTGGLKRTVVEFVMRLRDMRRLADGLKQARGANGYLR